MVPLLQWENNNYYIFCLCVCGLILLDFTTRTILCKEYRSLSSSLCTFLHSPVTSSLSRKMRWAGHVARMGEGRGVHRVLVGKPEGKRPLGRPRRRWEDNIKMDLQEVGGGCGDWMDLAQDRDRWRALVSTEKNLRVPKMRGIS